MLNIDKLGISDRRKIRTACAYLFSPREADDKNFIRNLDVNEVKKAFRTKARRYHPDLHTHENQAMQKRREERFFIIKDSYDYLISHIHVPKTEYKSEKKDITIIAVGGAKGGIGKSVFAANLGVVLSALGKKTVVADFDLGGANLHLYLGETRLERTVNDYVLKKESTLESLILKTRYGPGLIGGNSSLLGSANINYSKKLKLLKAIKTIKADFLILDLGGDTSYNMIDFFNISHTPIVMTTGEPASYLDAYNFIKVSLYRKLIRLFGSESGFTGVRDKVYETIAVDSLSAGGERRVRTIREFCERIRHEHYDMYPVLKGVLGAFKPLLVINRADEQGGAGGVSQRIREVSARMLGINVETAAVLPVFPEIETSAVDLVPVASRYPDGEMVKKLKAFIDTFVLLP